ncbi:MAG TPA: exopolysaccharide biosynthesis polyprenyl glycosylphosphotransferase [Gemmatimonadales bacterium]
MSDAAPGGNARLALSRRAPAALRRHLIRAVIRITVLATVDMIGLLLAWAAVAAIWHEPLPLGNIVAEGRVVLPVLIAIGVFGCYGSGDRRRQAGTIVKAIGCGVALALWDDLWRLGPALVLPLFFVDWLAAAAVLVFLRRVVDWSVRLVRPTGEGVARAVVFGASDDAVQIIDHPALGETPWCSLVGFHDPARAADRAAIDLPSLIQAQRADTLIIAGPLGDDHYAMAIDAARVAGCHVLSFPRVTPSLTDSPELVWRNGMAVMELTHPGRVGLERLIKRGVDLCTAAAGLLLLSWLMAVIAEVIRWTSPGPVFFRQVRIGQGGRTFTIYKFRTMAVASDQSRAALRDRNVYHDGRLFKVVSDPRITPFGRWLRLTSLDELPQLINVLRGEMSLVGPRPPLPSEVAEYHAKDFGRFDVKPGITGPWQVSGRNDVQDFDEVIRLERAYIRHWSLGLDLELLLRTIPAVLSGRGAH